MDDFAAEMARFEAEMAGAGAFEAPAANKAAPAAAAPAQYRVTASAPPQPTISAVSAAASVRTHDLMLPILRGLGCNA